MVRRGGRFMRFVATTNAQVEKEMELEASHPFYGESVEYAQMRQERERQRAALDQRRHRETTKPISVRASSWRLCPSINFFLLPFLARPSTPTILTHVT
jgi:hypothetical protein